jgi:hypothetical protein
VRDDAFTTSWLAARLAVDPARIEARRRAGELFGVPADGGRVHLYPGWQFDQAGNPLPAVEEILAAAKSAGLDAAGLEAFLDRRAGIGGPKLCELIRAGREDYVVAQLRSV